jgi:hypothetical protein
MLVYLSECKDSITGQKSVFLNEQLNISEVLTSKLTGSNKYIKSKKNKISEKS